VRGPSKHLPDTRNPTIPDSLIPLEVHDPGDQRMLYARGLNMYRRQYTITRVYEPTITLIQFYGKGGITVNGMSGTASGAFKTLLAILAVTENTPRHLVVTREIPAYISPGNTIIHIQPEQATVTTNQPSTITHTRQGTITITSQSTRYKNEHIVQAVGHHTITTRENGKWLVKTVYRVRR